MNVIREWKALLSRIRTSGTHTARSGAAAEQDCASSTSDNNAATNFSVYVADNFHYMDESETYVKRGYATWQEALAEARRIVIESVRHQYQPGMTADELYERYTLFGDDPAVLPTPAGMNFSAWGFAREQCEAMTGQRLSPRKG